MAAEAARRAAQEELDPETIPPAPNVTRQDILEQDEREAAARRAAREAQEARDRELMPPPAPYVTRRDTLVEDERPVPKQPPANVVRPLKSLEQISHDLAWARRLQRRADVTRLEDEFYRKLAVDYARAPMPSNAQEKYEMLLDVMKYFQARDWTNLTQYRALLHEYDRVFELVSFEFDDPAQQRIVYLGL
jgi:hypothetical protein